MSWIRLVVLLASATCLASCTFAPKQQPLSDEISVARSREEISTIVQALKLGSYRPGTPQVATFPPFSLRLADAFDEGTCGIKTRAVSVGMVQAADLQIAQETCARQSNYFATAASGSTASSPANWTTVDLFYGTDRGVTQNGPTRGFGNARGDLQFGSVKVAVPANHRVGHLERPTLWDKLLRRDPGGVFEILSLSVENQEAFAKQLRERVLQMQGRRMFIFVHGYNVSFADAALRTAQLAVDLDPAAVASFFSWPSQGAIRAYLIDSQNAEWTEANLRRFLEVAAVNSGADSIVVIAHSMGSRPASRALAGLLERRRDLRGRFKELVLAAPDIDADVFVRDLAPSYARLGLPVTLYASSSDRALQVSRSFNGSARAGDASPEPITVSGVEVIDATNVDTDFLGHAYVAETRPLLTDLTLLVKNRIRATDRPGLLPIRIRESVFWRFRK